MLVNDKFYINVPIVPRRHVRTLPERKMHGRRWQKIIGKRSDRFVLRIFKHALDMWGASREDDV